MPKENVGTKQIILGHLLVQVLCVYKSLNQTLLTHNKLQTFLSVYFKLKSVLCIQDIIISTFPIALLKFGSSQFPRTRVYCCWGNKGQFFWHYIKWCLLELMYELTVKVRREK